MYEFYLFHVRLHPGETSTPLAFPAAPPLTCQKPKQCICEFANVSYLPNEGVVVRVCKAALGEAVSRAGH